MSTYITEEEQLELIKKWWKHHGNMVSVLLSLILFGIAGYRYIIWHQEKITQQASINYEQMMLAVSNQDDISVKSYANQLFRDHSKSVYADAAHMTLAKIYISKNKLEQAQAQLQTVVNSSKLLSLKQIAKIRLARILVEKKSYTDALNELNRIEDSTYLPVINELKGDIYNATGQFKEAMNSYQQALAQVKNNSITNSFLEMKTNEIALKTESANKNDTQIKTA